MDQRQQRQLYQQRPPYPQVAQQTSSTHSATSSVFQSSSSLSSLSSSASSATPFSSQMSPSSSAPLPSPSVDQPMNYFSRAPTSHPTHTQQQRSIPQQQQPQQQTLAAQYVGQRPDGGSPETAPLLSNFGLLAEAAKRAQMACLSRDLGDIGL